MKLLQTRSPSLRCTSPLFFPGVDVCCQLLVYGSLTGVTGERAPAIKGCTTAMNLKTIIKLTKQ